MNNVSIIMGTRPQYIKTAVLLPWLKKYKINYKVYDTKQHYDFNFKSFLRIIILYYSSNFQLEKL